MRRAVAPAVGGLAVAALVVFGSLVQIALWGPQGGALVDGFENPSNSVEIMLLTGDGQFFSAVAQDPTLSDAGPYRRAYPSGPEAELAYRAQRPLLPYAAWVLSAGGRPELLPPVLLVLTLASASAAAAAFGILLGARGLRPELGALVVLLPGALASVTWLGPELAGLALVAAGFALRGRRPGLALLAFALAGLARETYLLVPAVLALTERRPRLLLSALPYAAWVGIVRLRVGAWPWSGGVYDRLSPPFLGYVQSWELEPLLVANVLVAGLGVALLIAGRRNPVVLAYAAFAVVLGPHVAGHWRDFSRPLLPLFAFGMLEALGRARAVRGRVLDAT